MRALKRFYSGKFAKSTDFHKKYTKKEKSQLFLQLITTFAEELFVKTGKLGSGLDPEVTFESVTYYLGMIISVDHIKKYTLQEW